MGKFKILFFLYIASAHFIVCQVKSDVKVGELAPEFEIISQNGDTVNSSNLRGKVILINIFATWCQPCIMELPLIRDKIWKKHRNDKDFQVLILGRDHTRQEIIDFNDKTNYGMQFFADNNNASYAFASKALPRNYIIDKDGYICYASKGFSEIEFNNMVITLNKLLK